MRAVGIIILIGFINKGVTGNSNSSTSSSSPAEGLTTGPTIGPTTGSTGGLTGGTAGGTAGDSGAGLTGGTAGGSAAGLTGGTAGSPTGSPAGVTENQSLLITETSQSVPSVTPTLSRTSNPALSTSRESTPPTIITGPNESIAPEMTSARLSEPSRTDATGSTTFSSISTESPSASQRTEPSLTTSQATQTDSSRDQTSRPHQTPEKKKIISFKKDDKGEGRNSTMRNICQKLMSSFEDANCTLKYTDKNSSIQFLSVVIEVNTSMAEQLFDQETTGSVDRTTLVAILGSCSALLAIIIGFAVYAACHHKSYRKNQPHLTEEPQTVENGYHDNPTLEVTEVQPEMWENKLLRNAEFGIVPIDNLTTEYTPMEEDTHL